MTQIHLLRPPLTVVYIGQYSPSNSWLFWTVYPLSQCWAVLGRIKPFTHLLRVVLDGEECRVDEHHPAKDPQHFQNIITWSIIEKVNLNS